MKRSDINNKLRGFARTLSPTTAEQAIVACIYSSLEKLLSSENCIKIGSFPRFTATTPIHDLDILYVLGDWDDGEGIQDPDAALDSVCGLIQDSYQDFCPEGYAFTVDVQNHSVTIDYTGEKKLSVDIVPCYNFSQNEFKQPMHKVPHVIEQRSHVKRATETWDPMDLNQWISSDPLGYITQASVVGQNSDFRKVVKIVKFWKRTLRKNDDSLKLKSFHLEQVITRQFQANQDLDVITAIFNFFIGLEDVIDKPNAIEDRAQAGKYIDDYLIDLTGYQKRTIKKACDAVLVNLEEATESSSFEEIFTAAFYSRDPREQFMFDFGKLMLADKNSEFDISYDEQDKHENRLMRRARKKLRLPKEKELLFKIIEGYRSDLTYFWKVQNSKQLPDKSQRRGEITMHNTKNYPEHTEYLGEHYVECFGVDSDECVCRARCEVAIGGNNE